MIGDASLIGATLYVFWRMKLSKGQRLLILCIFASSIISEMAGIVYAVFVFQADTLGNARGLLISVTAHLKVRLISSYIFTSALIEKWQATITLLVCNLFVIVSFIYRVSGKDADMESPEPLLETDKDEKASTTSSVRSFHLK